MPTAIQDALFSVPKEIPGSPDLSRVREEWELLAEKVRAYDPTVVILVARKPVRMFQALEVDPAPGALVISDLAIPFMGNALEGARVAVVDDVVNVGSTLRRACRRVEKAEAAEVEAFAISHRVREHSLDGLRVHYSGTAELDAFDLQQFGRRVPQTLQWHSKPYDLTFPVMECDLMPPFGRFENLLAAMRGRYGDKYVYDLSTPAGSSHGMGRSAVDLTDGEALRKVNLYINESAGTCTVVPIAITPILQPDGLALNPSPWAGAIWEAMRGLPQKDELEARCRLSLFVDALTLGESFLAEHCGFLRQRGPQPFSMKDAELALGPAIGRVEPGEDSHQLRRFRSVQDEDRPVTSPFLEAAIERGFVAKVAKVARADDPLSVFIACFEELGSQIGAGEPADYCFDWPYSYEEIEREPYLRLRIGPTLADLVAIVDSITEADNLGVTRRRVTRLLDRYIDSGGVVPTVATYEGEAYRIYRLGESSTREDVSRRVRYAWQCYGKPLSLTRATKYLTILALDLAQADSQVEIEAAPRGNTLCFHPSILDSRTEITQYLRNTSQLREVDDE